MGRCGPSLKKKIERGGVEKSHNQKGKHVIRFKGEHAKQFAKSCVFYVTFAFRCFFPFLGVCFIVRCGGSFHSFVVMLYCVHVLRCSMVFFLAPCVAIRCSVYCAVCCGAVFVSVRWRDVEMSRDLGGGRSRVVSDGLGCGVLCGWRLWLRKIGR